MWMQFPTIRHARDLAEFRKSTDIKLVPPAPCLQHIGTSLMLTPSAGGFSGILSYARVPNLERLLSKGPLGVLPKVIPSDVIPSQAEHALASLESWDCGL